MCFKWLIWDIPSLVYWAFDNVLSDFFKSNWDLVFIITSVIGKKIANWLFVLELRL